MYLVMRDGKHVEAPSIYGYYCVGTEARTEKGDVYIDIHRPLALNRITFPYLGQSFSKAFSKPPISQYMVYRPIAGYGTRLPLNAYHSRRLPLP